MNYMQLYRWFNNTVFVYTFQTENSNFKNLHILSIYSIRCYHAFAMFYGVKGLTIFLATVVC